MSALLRHLVQVCAAMILLTGGIALLGHVLGWEPLYAPVPATIGMAPNTAWCFFLVGLALWVLGTRDR